MLRVAVLCALVAALLAATPAQVSRCARFGIQDDAWLAGGPGTLPDRLATLQRLDANLVRFTIR